MKMKMKSKSKKMMKEKISKIKKHLTLFKQKMSKARVYVYIVDIQLNEEKKKEKIDTTMINEFCTKLFCHLLERARIKQIDITYLKMIIKQIFVKVELKYKIKYCRFI